MIIGLADERTKGMGRSVHRFYNVAMVNSTSPAHELAAAFRDGSLSPLDALEVVTRRAAELEPEINALSWIDVEGARAHARESAARYRVGVPRSALDGVPITVKELLAVKGWPLRRGSCSSSDAVSLQDAPLVARLREAGAVLWAQTTSAEWGWKPLSENQLSGATRNPLNRRWTAGGSSGGSGAAVAGGYGPISIGSDAAGSVRIPAAFCGLAGLKPSRGSRFGLPLSPFGFVASAGPIAQNVVDLTMAWDAVEGRETVPPEVNPEGLRIGFLLPEAEELHVEHEVLRAFTAAVDRLAEAGVHVIRLNMPSNFSEVQNAMETIWKVALAVVVDRTPVERRERMERGLLEMAAEGRTFSGRDIVKAQMISEELAGRIEDHFRNVDAILTPTTACGPFDTGRLTPAGWPRHDWMSWIPFTYPFNLSGHPAVALPAAPEGDPRPHSVQLVGPRAGDGALLAIAMMAEPVLAAPGRNA